MKRVFFLCVTCICSVGVIMAQTTLSGDHVIAGDLDVGSTGALGGLRVNGETGNAAVPGIRVTGDGGVSFEGTTGTGQIPATGAGTRFMWYPKKAALRAGLLTNGEKWDDEFIGIGSLALNDSEAWGSNSVALAGGAAYGNKSVSIFGWAYGNHSIALGSEAYGDYSITMAGGMAYGALSIAATNGITGTDASSSVALNGGITSAQLSFAVGLNAIADTYGSVVFGRNNAPADTSPNSAEEWVETDPLFSVGNGTGLWSDPPEVRNRDAFVIYKNGNARFAKRQGDILMGEFGNPE